MEQPPAEMPTREHLREWWMQSQIVLRSADHALKGDPEKRRIVLDAVERLKALAVERDIDYAVACNRQPAPLDGQGFLGLGQVMRFYGWPDDVSWCLADTYHALSRIAPMIGRQTTYEHRWWREAMADIREATQRLGEIVGTLDTPLRDDPDAAEKPGPAASDAPVVKPDPVLDEIDVKILKELAKYNHTLKLVDLATNARIDPTKTCPNHVNRLIELGYVERKSKRSGVSITQKGRLLV